MRGNLNQFLDSSTRYLADCFKVAVISPPNLTTIIVGAEDFGDLWRQSGSNLF